VSKAGGESLACAGLLLLLLLVLVLLLLLLLLLLNVHAQDLLLVVKPEPAPAVLHFLHACLQLCSDYALLVLPSPLPLPLALPPPVWPSFGYRCPLCQGCNHLTGLLT
jgi:hypothetical protein